MLFRSLYVKKLTSLYPLLLIPLLYPITTIALPDERGLKNLFSPVIPSKIHAIASSQDPSRYPHYTTQDSGKWVYVDADTWTTGFFPGTLYLLAERTKLCKGAGKGEWDEERWLELGRSWSTGMLRLTQGNKAQHDQGFLSYPFVEELKVNPQNATAIKAVNDFAAILAARFSALVGTTRSWDHDIYGPNDWPVIIDNMMNFELLFISSELTGNPTLKSIARAHADTTIKNQFREDGSTWQVVTYNNATGDVIRKYTKQGYDNSSTWARGQAWAIHGYADMYRLTGDDAYLQTARRSADYFLSHTPSDNVVPWDFNSPEDLADTSAASIAAAGLLILATVEKNLRNKAKWTRGALRLLKGTIDFAWAPTWDSILSNATSHHPIARR